MMENLSDPQTLYKELVFTSFDKIKKHLQKKDKDILQLISQFIEQLKDDRELNANKYYSVFRLCIETRDTKLVETSLHYLHKLVSHGFLDGSCSDFVTRSSPDDKKKTESPRVPTQSRKLIDSIVENICMCKNEKNENIQLQIIKLLLTLVTSMTCEVHGKSLQETVRTLFTIYLTTKNPVNQATARAALTQIVNVIFQRMEEYNSKDEDYRAKRKEVPSIMNTKFKNPERKKTVMDSQPFLTNQLSGGPANALLQRSNSPDAQSMMDRYFNRDDDAFSVASSSVASTYTYLPEQMMLEHFDSRPGGGGISGTPDERYIYRCVKNLVDDVCLYFGKVDAVKQQSKHANVEEKKSLEMYLEDMPLKSVPLTLESDDKRYRMLMKIDLENEIGEHAGYFGWCIMCRGAANLYCKDTRVPVCSFECKNLHQIELKKLKEHTSREDAFSTSVYFQDAFQLFSYLCKLSGKDPANDGSATSLRSKTLTLELIVSIMENPGPTFLSREEFRDVIREHLCDSILKNSVSTDKPVFAYSLGTFVSLVNNFREILKSEIAVFIENIFLKMLESGNSSFNHRSLALQVFYKITSKARTMLEFYVNYDCSMGSTNIVEKIIDLLCKIAQGKYLRPEYSALIAPQQEPHLKILALESLVNLAKSLVRFTEEYQKRMEELNKLKNSSMEMEREGEDFETIMGEDYRGDIFDRTDGIEKQRMMKNEIQKAIHKFNFKIKLGLKYFEKLGIIQMDDAKSMATFFFNTPGLSKQNLGEYFGEEYEFNIKVLTEFAELVNFKGLGLDQGLRAFLSLFYLPGESQKIDRVMQVFAAKFFKDNPKSFNSANAAYTLSYLLIMLQTDAHNPQVKKEEKMKVDQFVKLARGINDGQDLPPEELVAIYNRIQERPLAMRDESKKTDDTQNNQSLKKKEEQFKLESAKMIEKGKEMIKHKKDEQYYKVVNTEYLRPFFTEVLWSPILAVFGVVLERYEEPKIVQLCLEGLSNCVVLTGLLRMDTERDTFLLSLVKFTNLKPAREIKEKNAKCIKLVLQLAATHGHLFKHSWKYVLECISKIDYYLHYSPLQSQSDIHREESPKNPTIALVAPLDTTNSEVIKSIVDHNVINHIFNKSGTFNLDEIMDFITCLCQMSEDELKDPQGPRIFGLQKLVEVAHFNMDRIKFIWSQIWNIMREHISKVAINSNDEVAFFAVDSLKQLSIKFLIKEELASLEFQKEFLKPFETICQKVQSDKTKEYVLDCCDYIISKVMKDIKSGWKIIIDILIIAADSGKDSLIKLSFQITEKIIKTNLDVLKEVFADTALLLLKLAKYKNDEIATACLKHLKTLITNMVQQHETYATHKYEGQPYMSFNELDEEGNEGDRIVLVYGIDENVWVKLLVALVDVCVSSRRRVHMQSVITLFDILRTYGDGFSKEKWTEIMDLAIKPLFSGVQNTFQAKKFTSDDDFLIYNETCREAFLRMIDIYNLYYGKLGLLLENFLVILASCSQSPHEQFAQITIGALRYIINRCNSHFKTFEWELIIDAFERICKNTIPKQLLTYSTGPSASSPDGRNKPEESTPEKGQSDASLVQCIIQLMMIALIKDVTETYGHRFTDSQILRVSKILYESYEFAKRFNEQMYLRFVLWKKGPLRDTDQLPALLKQEKESFSTYAMLVFNLYNRKKTSEEPDEVAKIRHLNEFIDLGLILMKSFCAKNEEYIKFIKIPLPAVEEPQNRRVQTFDYDYIDLKEMFAKQEAKLKIHELEREITNAKTMLITVLLPNLAKIDPSEMKNRLRELVTGLINVAFYYIPKVTMQGEQGQQPATSTAEDDSQGHTKGFDNINHKNEKKYSYGE